MASPITPRCLLLDIEGTTTPIRFVHDTLFGLVREQLVSFLDTEWTRPDVQESIALLRQQAAEDRQRGIDACPAIPDASSASDDTIKQAVVDNVFWQMDDDRKTGSLKRLQGQIWRRAYEAGMVKSAVFDDVVPALHRCQALQVPVYVYSSGSVEAQQLM
ncbi:hypothetical protein SYNPS1DRAFT_17232, partial [Syncephalis pseudoplumigaleata]